MSQNNPPTHNPHAAAAGAYGAQAQKTTPDQRELEARVLLKAVNAFQELQNKWDDVTPQVLEDALLYNRNIWMMFVDTAMEDKSEARGNDLRSNIANLGIFIFKTSAEILAEPKKEKLNILIDINREIAAGLMTRPKADTAATQAAADKK